MMPELGGQTLGKYQLIERLGRGGMADVYKGFQPGLERFVAVKVLHPHLAEEKDFITRFKREAKAVASLRHPNIINVFDFDIDGQNYFMVMEYVEGGKTLKEVLTELAAQGQRLPLEHTLDIVARLAEALDYAHKQGMVHRDIKPSNILLPSLTQPVLADFGIARIVGQTGLTGSGAMIGTPAYMSPEQGRGEQADERSDIYALGIVLYEMLTGKPPYDADTPYGVILKHINDPLTSPRLVVGDLPAVVEAVALKALAKDTGERYQSAGAMAEALRKIIEQLADGTAVSSPTPAMGTAMPASAETEQIAVPSAGATVAAARPARKGPKLALIAGGIGLVVLVALGVIFGPGLLNPPDGGGDSPPFATAGASVSEGSSQDAQAFVDEGMAQLFQGGDSDAAFQSFSAALEIDPGNVDALAGQALVHMSRSEEEQAGEVIFHAAELAPDDPFVNYVLGRVYSNTSAYYDADAAMAAFTRSIEGCGDDAFLCANSYGERAYLLAWSVGDPEAGLADLNQAIALDPDPNNLPNRYSARADMYYHGLGDSDSALADLETAYEQSGNNYWYLTGAATIAIEIGEHERALNYYQRLINEQGGDPIFVVGRGYVRRLMGDLDAGLEDAGQALQLEPDLLSAHYLFALILLDQGGSPGVALGHLGTIRDQESTWYDDQQYDLGLFSTRFGHELYYDMARGTLAFGDPAGALELLTISTDHEDWAQPYILRGQILAAQGDLEGAREAYLAALDRAYDNPDLQAQINELLAGLAGD